MSDLSLNRLGRLSPLPSSPEIRRASSPRNPDTYETVQATPAAPRVASPLPSPGTPPVASAFDALLARDVRENCGNVAKLFSKQPHDPVLRRTGLELALLQKFSPEKLTPAQLHELRIIRTVRAIDTAHDSKASLNSLIAQQKASLGTMPFLVSGTAMNEQCVAEQEEIIRDNEADLASLRSRS